MTKINFKNKIFLFITTFLSFFIYSQTKNIFTKILSLIPISLYLIWYIRNIENFGFDENKIKKEKIIIFIIFFLLTINLIKLILL